MFKGFAKGRAAGSLRVVASEEAKPKVAKAVVAKGDRTVARFLDKQ